MAVYPANESVLVNRIGELTGVDLDTVFSLVNLDGKFGTWLIGRTCLDGHHGHRFGVFYRGFNQEEPVPLPNHVPNCFDLLLGHHVSANHSAH